MKELEHFKNWYETIVPDPHWLIRTKQELFSWDQTHEKGEYVFEKPRSLRFAFRLWPAFAWTIVLLIFSSSGLIFAMGSKPGDTGYPLKRLAEETRIFFAVSPEEKMTLRKNLVVKRFNELSSLVKENNSSALSYGIDEVLAALAKVPDLDKTYQNELKSLVGMDPRIEELLEKNEASVSATPPSEFLEATSSSLIIPAEVLGTTSLLERQEPVEVHGEENEKENGQGNEKKEEKEKKEKNTDTSSSDENNDSSKKEPQKNK